MLERAITCPRVSRLLQSHLHSLSLELLTPISTISPGPEFTQGRHLSLPHYPSIAAEFYRVLQAASL